MRAFLLRAVLCSTVLALWGLQVGGMAISDATAAGKEFKELTIEVTVKNMEFHVSGLSREGYPTAIVVHNKDGVTHGFYSDLFKNVPVRLEGDGYKVEGKLGPSFHVDPGKTMTLHFTKGAAEGHGSILSPLTRHAIWCDIHEDVKGEVMVVEQRG